MDHVLPLLIERATKFRDRQAAATQQARMSAQQAEATLDRLGAFRVDCLAQSPGGTLARTTGEALAGYQQFDARLDDAIGMQSREADHRYARFGEQQQLLSEAQRRLLAFEALQRRRTDERRAKEQRIAQRESDEFAARATRRRDTR
jgi:flagellar export protein FliJ